MPFASVILPVYNAEKYIDAAIESVLNQSFSDFELLLLNDGSTDNSLQRLHYYASIDARCKVFSWPNQGIVNTCNKGIELASAELLIRMDSDDICLPSRFEAQINYMNNHPDCAVLGAAITLIDADGAPIMQGETPLLHDEIDTANMTGAGAFIYHPTYIMRKSKVLAVGGYRELYKHAEDLDLLLRLAEIGNLANLSQVQLLYRQHAESIGYTKRAEQVKAAQLAVIDACQRRNMEVSREILDMSVPSVSPSLFEVHTKWAWWALGSGNLETARKHAWKAFLQEPYRMGNLKLYVCVARSTLTSRNNRD